MNKLIVVLAGVFFSAGVACAQTPASASAASAKASCADRAVDKNNKPLAGAAKDSFMKKCEKDSMAANASAACEAKAIDKNGKALAGAAKTSFMKKCEADAGKK